jgi:uncharacterized protein (TIGR03435 family)
MKPLASFLLLAYAVSAQQDTTPLAFEVASVKVARPFTPGAGAARGCSKANPAMVRCNGITLKMLLMWAYGMDWQQQRSYQIQGPDWIDSESYDVMAKLPEGVAGDKLPAMLQVLLAERFRLKLHKESHILPGYELSAAKGGAKLKQVDVAKLPGTLAPGNGKGRPTPLNGMPNGVLAMSSRAGGVRVARGNVTMEQLTNYLTGQLNCPVFDGTGLKGTYGIDLSYVPDEMGGADASAPVATLAQALQALGLKLDPKKAPVDVIVIDRANKVPTQN